MEDGIETLTVYAFSTENWGRDVIEVSNLMSMFSKYAQNFKDEALARNVKVLVISTGI
jgi:undecaprenyl diphosphate synthase